MSTASWGNQDSWSACIQDSLQGPTSSTGSSKPSLCDRAGEGLHTG